MLVSLLALSAAITAGVYYVSTRYVQVQNLTQSAEQTSYYKTAMGSTIDYLKYAIKERWCINPDGTQYLGSANLPCDLTNSRNTELLVMSDQGLTASNPANPPVRPASISGIFDPKAILSNHPLYNVVQSFPVGTTFTYALSRISSQGAPAGAGQQAYIQIQTVATLPGGKTLLNSQGVTTFTTTATIAAVQRQLSSYSLIVNGDLVADAAMPTQAPAGSVQFPWYDTSIPTPGVTPGVIRFQSAVFSNHDLVLPGSAVPTSFSQVNFQGGVVLGNGTVVRDNVAFSPSSAGGVGSMYLEELSTRFGGITSGIKIDSDVDSGLSFLFGNPAMPSQQLVACHDWALVKSALDLTRSSQLLIQEPASPTATPGVSEIYTFNLGLSYRDAFIPQPNLSPLPTRPLSVVLNHSNAWVGSTPGKLVVTGALAPVLRVTVGDGTLSGPLPGPTPVATNAIFTAALGLDATVVYTLNVSTTIASLNSTLASLQSALAQLTAAQTALTAAQAAQTAGNGSLKTACSALTAAGGRSADCPPSPAATSAPCDLPNSSANVALCQAVATALQSESTDTTAVTAAQAKLSALQNQFGSVSALNTQITTVTAQINLLTESPPAIQLAVAPVSPSRGDQVKLQLQLQNMSSFPNEIPMLRLQIEAFDVGYNGGGVDMRLNDAAPGPNYVSIGLPGPAYSNLLQVSLSGHLGDATRVGGPASLPDQNTNVSIKGVTLQWNAPPWQTFYPQPVSTPAPPGVSTGLVSYESQAVGPGGAGLESWNYITQAQGLSFEGSNPGGTYDPAVLEQTCIPPSNANYPSAAFGVETNESSNYAANSPYSWNFKPPSVYKPKQLANVPVRNVVIIGRDANGADALSLADFNDSAGNQNAEIFNTTDSGTVGIFSMADTCTIFPHVSLFAGFLTCKTLHIKGPRTTNLTIRGTAIVNNLVVDPSAFSKGAGIIWSSLFDSRALADLVAPQANQGMPVLNHNHSACSLTADIYAPQTPVLWASYSPADSSQSFLSMDQIARLNDCSLASLTQNADPFSWSQVDPVCGIPVTSGPSPDYSSCKNAYLPKRLEVFEIQRSNR
jgi:hypothetical protein